MYKRQVLLVLVLLHRNACLCLMLSPALAPFAPKRKEGHWAGWRPSGALSRHGLRHGAPHEVPVTQVMTTKGARRAPVAQCPPFLFGAKGASAGESIKQRHPFRCNETKTSPTAGRKSLWSPSRRHRQSLWQARANLIRIGVPAVPLQNGQLLAPFPLNIWEEDQGLAL